MPKSEINTGFAQLDSDLTDLFAVLEGEVLPRIKDGLAKNTLTKAELGSLFPRGAFKLSVALSSAPNYALIVTGKSKQARGVIDNARDLVSKELKDLLTHPIAVERLRGLESEDAQDEKSPLGENLNSISRTEHAHMWFGTPEALVPAVRIGFISRSRRLLLDSTLQLDDLAFVAVTMVKILAEMMERAEKLARDKRINVGDADKLGDRLRTIEEHLTKAKKLAHVYGIEINGASDPESEDTDTDTARE